ncbi:pentatricopeptide repeat-containing protein At3g26782, mitochondrial-like [Selaginella moellendorffii]|uniref:pentatricopeptide repeat-containing protein At3g26782, mitochondrial-like n=1 Tax=Selaginella moellendorffii TaxID=88036 RepID=UPI000D1CCF63|nr:pentatricopeptide repeat-containing protein At3g26782, mitochondrial-like [Selaginella moellendorffii]|eukprot:XP_024542953.1 pentatricopeptide repeat-containing protein At3g26782, mitochondrial-like [Selaginella moellendorffii]
MYAKCGAMVDAARVFAKMDRHSIVSWNSLILGYAENGQGELALVLFASMERRTSFHFDGRTFVAALKACTSLAVEESKASGSKTMVKPVSLEKSMAVHALAAARGFQEDVFVKNTLVDAYAKCGSMADAWRVFAGAGNRDLITWNALVQGFADCGEEQLAFEFLSMMEVEALRADGLSFTASFKACAGLAEKEQGREIDGTMVKTKALEKTMALHVQASRKNLDSREIMVVNALVDAYAKSGSLTDASRAFARIQKRDLVLWNTLLAGHASNEHGEETLDLFFQMIMDDHTEPDARSFVAVLKASGTMVALSATRLIHSEICRRGVADENEIIACSLLDSYARCGSMQSALQVFDSLAKPDSVLWTALLSGYSREGNTRLVFETFRAFLDQGFLPNSVTFVCLLTASSHAGLVAKGQAIFQAMELKFGIQPGPEHYLCVVDLLGRGNRLDEAVKMVEAMKGATVGHWMTVLGACKKWKNAEMAKLAFEKVVELDERDPAAYSLMLATYASLGMWQEMPRVYEMRRKGGGLARPGLSWWTDETGAVHKFVAGDVRHPQMEEIQRKLGELAVKMDEQGYVADLASSARKRASDAEKERSLCCHSERLAIACALVNSSPGTTIRIAKNLRVCDDCHSATAFFSRIERREIICRDSSRFHAFRDGACSCGDFW